jgi:hypothetical protein
MKYTLPNYNLTVPIVNGSAVEVTDFIRKNGWIMISMEWFLHLRKI